MKEKLTIIGPASSSWKFTDIFSIWNNKDLFLEFVIRDIKMRHKQTLLGVLWVVLQPVMSTIIFTVIFSFVLKIPSNSLPYPVFVLVGLNFWILFSSSVTAASNSLVMNESLIKKVYFPRIIIPLSVIAVNLFDFLISTIFLAVVLFIYKISPDPLTILVFPLLATLVAVSCMGIGLLLSSLNVRYRDIGQILPFFIQILIFLTPVFFPTTMISEQNRWILSLNPLTTVIEIARGLLANNLDVNIVNIIISVVSATILLILGIWHFKRTEKHFADII